MRATCSVYLIIVDFIALMISGEEYELEAVWFSLSPCYLSQNTFHCMCKIT
jgi:hypothetical protein